MASSRRGFARGPIWVPSVRPSPTVRPSATLARAAPKSLATERWTRKRVGEMQTWPALRNLAAPSVLTASSRSASSHTITGAWPPSSIDDPLHVLPGECGELLADRRRPGEGDLADGGVRDEVAGDLGRVAVDQREHARGQAGVLEGADERGRGGRGLLGRLDDHRAARGQRRRATLRTTWLIGKFQGANAATGPDGSLMTICRIARLARWGTDAAVDPQALVGEPVDDVGGRHRLALGLDERLALFEGHEAGDLVRPLADQLGRPSHDLAALAGVGHARPRTRAARRRGRGRGPTSRRGPPNRSLPRSRGCGPGSCARRPRRPSRRR